MAEIKHTAEHPAIAHLRSHPRQLDMDGIEVGVSRQALDETLEIVGALMAALLAQEERQQRGLFNMTEAEIQRVHDLRRTALSKAHGTVEGKE